MEEIKGNLIQSTECAPLVAIILTEVVSCMTTLLKGGQTHDNMLNMVTHETTSECVTEEVRNFIKAVANMNI